MLYGGSKLHHPRCRDGATVFAHNVLSGNMEGPLLHLRDAGVDLFANSGTVDAEPGRITVHGPRRLSGAHAVSTDLRGSMAQILAAICAEGQSRVEGVELALRGYNELPQKLAALGLEAAWND